MKNRIKIGLALIATLLIFPAVVVGGDGEQSVIYSPIGKRDPFRAAIAKTADREVAGLSPLELFTVDQLQLRAILRGLGKQRAMLEDPSGKTHIVTEGQIIGRERATVSRILKSEVIVTQKTFNYLGEQSLSERILSLQSADESSNSPVRKGPQ
jgi:Tfp pilus assembly protein PilP